MKVQGLEIPEQLRDKYEVLAKLNQWGDGALFRVRHRQTGDVRTAKVMATFDVDDENLPMRFRREARIAQRLEHPNIVRLYDFTIGNGCACFVKDVVQGRTLRDVLSVDGPPTVARTVEIAVQALQAVSYIHSQGYFHRGITPESLMIVETLDGELLVKLLELGLAKHLGGREDLTSAETFLGQAPYTAPELFEDDDSQPDRRSDLYSFGVVLYELLTGQHPNRGSSFREHYEGHLRRPPRSFSETDAAGRIPEALRTVVLASLEKDPRDRIRSADEFIDRLQPFRIVDA